MENVFDIIIIGGGVIGSAVARELSRYDYKIAVLEKNPDVCCETSGRNSGVLHAGFNNKPGSLMARFCVEGNRMFEQLSKDLDIPFKRTGKLVVGFDENDRIRLEAMKETGIKNNVPGLEIIDKSKIRELAPEVSGEFALWSPSTGVFNPFRLTIGLAENAVKNGVKYHLNTCVTGISRSDSIYHITTG